MTSKAFVGIGLGSLTRASKIGNKNFALPCGFDFHREAKVEHAAKRSVGRESRVSVVMKS